jgi:hypothetical protein
MLNFYQINKDGKIQTRDRFGHQGSNSINKQSQPNNLNY